MNYHISLRLVKLVLVAVGLFVGGTLQASEPSSPQATLLFGIGVHIEPLGAVPSSLVGGSSAPGQGGNGPNYNNQVFFEHHVQDLKTVAEIVERHSGLLTVQAQTPFTRVASESGETILADLEARGHEISLHFHEDAHLGRNPEGLPVATWCAVMQEEIGFIHQAGVKNSIRYWSGGNLYPDLLQAASCAGLDINSDWKNPKTQTTDERLIGINPWRPAGGPTETDVTAFARHDPQGKIIFLPEGLYDRTDFASMRRSESSGGDEAYFNFLKQSLENSVAAADPDRINVFHFTVHPGEFRGDPSRPFAIIDQFLTDVVDPLVAAGKIRWATFPQMADAFAQWEEAHPGVDPRSTATAAAPSNTKTPVARASASPAGYMTFAVNVHDWRHIDESADTLLRLIGIFEKYGVRGDFYLTAPMVEMYAKQRPDVLTRLKESGMTISYHVRPPDPLYTGFDQSLLGLDDQALMTTLHDYETYRLDLATGDLDRDHPGGYTYVTQTLGRVPVVVGAPTNDQRIKTAALKLYKELGGQMAVIYHECCADPNQPFEYRDGLLVRPSDFSITRWAVNDKPVAFWWNMLESPLASDYDPTVYLQKQLASWQGKRQPFVTSLIHENNFYRSGPESWTLVYYADREKTQPLSPPFDLSAPDPSQLRSSQNQEEIWAAYEQLVAYAAANLHVVTSEDIVTLAKAASDSSRTMARATSTDAAVTLTLSADLPDSPIRPLLGVNAGPAPAGEPGNVDLTSRYQQAGVSMVRTHDFYGPMDMSTLYPNQSADPANPASYNFTASDQAFSAIVQGGFEPYLRLGDSYNNVRRITSISNWVRAAVEVVRHYNDPARWGASHLHYVEIWNEPDNAHFWLGDRTEFFQLFAEAAKALKAAFPNLKIGGPGLTPAGFKSPQGQSFTRALLDSAQSNNVPLDFFSWHMYSNDPADFVNAASFYRTLLNSHGYTTIESHISEWNTEFREGRDTDPTVRTGAKGAALMSAAWIGLQQQGITASTLYRGNDPSINAPAWYGIFYADGRPKPVGLALTLWSQMASHPLRSDITVSDANELQALAGHNTTGEFTVLIVNSTDTPTSWQIAGFPMSTNYTITLSQITDPAQEIQTTTLSELRSKIGAYATQLVTLKPASTADNAASSSRDSSKENTLVATPFRASQTGRVDRDVTYCTADGVTLKMDIYHPTTTTSSPAPVAVYVHGGGWTGGDKSGGEGIKDIPELVARGYLVSSVNYRLAPRYKFPAQIEDVKCAIRFLRANAEKYGINPDKIGAWGGSAGGHLVSLLGVTDSSAGLEGSGGYLEQSSRVQAVVDMFGPADLTVTDFMNLHALLLQQVFGTSDPRSEILKHASPVSWISSDDPPFLILQGERDDVVPPSQSQEFYDQLKAAGVPATLVMVKNAGHGFAPVGGSISPTRDELTHMMADFFDRYLK